MRSKEVSKWLRAWLTAAMVAFVLCVFVGNVSASAAEVEPESLVFTDPYMTSLNPSTEMNIMWLVKSGASTGIVEYGPTPALGSTAEAELFQISGLRTSATAEGYADDPESNPEVEVYQLIAKLEGLTPGSVVYYRVTTKDGANEEVGKRYFFQTAPEAGEAFDFVLLSDMQLKVKTKETIKFLGQQSADFIMFSGDSINTPWKVGEWMPYEGTFQAPGEEDRTFFECLSQTEDNTHLMQYMPIFIVPGNHEVDDQRVFTDKEMAQNNDAWSLSIFMQMFRPLYPDQEYPMGGKHWYSLNYGDLHITGLSVLRWQAWDGFEFPGWITKDDISPDSDQVKWLQEDLSSNTSKYKWVMMHWHMLNRGEDGWFPASTAVEDPANPGAAIYPDGDYTWDVLRPMYEAYGVDAVNFGHSHVYERYLIGGVNYIEAASIGNNYRLDNEPYHPSGNMPIIEANQFRSILLVSVTPEAMTAKGIQASVEDNSIGYIGRVIEEFVIAE